MSDQQGQDKGKRKEGNDSQLVGSSEQAGPERQGAEARDARDQVEKQILLMRQLEMGLPFTYGSMDQASVLQAKLNAEILKRETLEGEVTSLRATIAQLKKEHREDRAALEDGHRENRAALKAEIKQLQRDIAERDETIKQLRAKITDLEKELADVKGEMTEIRRHHEGEMTEMRRHHDKEMTEMRRHHDKEMHLLKNAVADLKLESAANHARCIARHVVSLYLDELVVTFVEEWNDSTDSDPIDISIKTWGDLWTAQKKWPRNDRDAARCMLKRIAYERFGLSQRDYSMLHKFKTTANGVYHPSPLFRSTAKETIAGPLDEDDYLKKLLLHLCDHVEGLDEEGDDWM